MTINLIRTLFVMFMAFVGSQIGVLFGLTALGGTAAGVVFGLMVVLLDRLMRGVSLRLFSSATFGLLMGALLAHLVRNSDVLRNLKPDLQWVVSLLMYSTGGYLGTMLALRSNRQDFSLIIPYVRFREGAVQDAPLLVDSNILIDGRIADLSATGFLSSSLIVPRFVLEELQRMADSADTLKRARGRRGLDHVQALQRNPAISLSIQESQLGEDGAAVDTRLVQLARILQARLLTNDQNLCALARLQGVTPLNLHDLERVLKPALAMGDRIELSLSKEGREPHQGVGYLPDGTMIVVNHARQFVGQTVPITISSALQTGAGRLFFAELENGTH